MTLVAEAGRRSMYLTRDSAPCNGGWVTVSIQSTPVEDGDLAAVWKKFTEYERRTAEPLWDVDEGTAIPKVLWQRAHDYFLQAHRELRLVARFGPAIDGTIHLSWVSSAGDKEFQIEVGPQGDFWSEWKGGYEYSGGVTGDQKEFMSRIRKYFAN